jgi:Type VI secretion system (T6SS), amidase effector protein 4
MAPAPRPAFTTAWTNFSKINVSVPEVAKIVKGKVQWNIDNGIFTNACPIRMSYVLNKTIFTIPGPGHGYAVSSGGDHMWYMYRVTDMMKYLRKTFGEPDKTVTSPKPTDFSGTNGIILIEGTGWKDATGHVTLFNGVGCQDSCHLLGDASNGNFTPETGSIWLLP